VTGREVFSGIAARYDRLNTVLSLGRDQAWRRSVIDHLPPGRVLDLGAGTGAANEVFGDRDVVALDPAFEMLGLNGARRRIVGVGERLPFEDRSFDAVFSAFVFRNLDSVGDTLGEIARVLAPGGKAGVVDLGRPPGTWSRRLHRLGTAVVLPIAGASIGARREYTYLHQTLDEHPGPELLLAPGPLRVERVWRMGPLDFVWGAVLSSS
jgi:demethylmenaquinone methyltransferase/2-methoxy-6-polyprenyl-1,4-benzoquinol methylase